MATRRPPSGERTSASDALRAAIAADAVAIGADIATLGADDVVRLRRILAGEEIVGYPVSLKRSWGVLVRSDPSAATAKVLGQALSEQTLPRRDRMAAAAYLGLLPPKVAEEPLLAALPSAYGGLRGEIIKAIGQVGTARALSGLRSIRDDGDETVQRQLALAQLAIRLRGKKLGGPGPTLGAALGIGWREVEAKAVSARQLRQTLATFRGPAYGMPVSLEMGLQFLCGGIRHVVLFNQELRRGNLLKCAASRGLIAGLVVAEGEKGMKHFFLRWLLLTNPAKDGIEMALVRPSGEPVLAGGAVPNGKALAFVLRDTGLDRTPMELTGRVTSRDVSWTLRLWVGQVRDKARPRAILPQAIPAG